MKMSNTGVARCCPPCNPSCCCALVWFPPFSAALAVTSESDMYISRVEWGRMGESPKLSIGAVAAVAAVAVQCCYFVIFKKLLFLFISDTGGEVMNYYLISLATADLLAGVLVVPLSIYPALMANSSWVLGDVLCSIVGYVEATLWSVSVYSFMWISVDRYLAIRKPLRYETVQTPSRCQCWVIFTWLTSMLACCPPLLQGSTGDSVKPIFDREAFVCHLDWTGMSAYSVTLIILVLGPTLATVAYTYFYIFSSMRKMRNSLLAQDKEYATALSENLSNPTHLMSFVLVMTFWLSWLPFICLTLYEYLTQHRIEVSINRISFLLNISYLFISFHLILL